MKRYIYVGSLNYADEFDAFSIDILDEEDYNYLQSKLDYLFEDEELYIGSNEGIPLEDKTVRTILKNFKMSVLDEEQYKLLVNIGICYKGCCAKSFNLIEKIIEHIQDNEGE